MPNSSFRFLDRMAFSRSMRWWGKAAQNAPETSIQVLRDQRKHARALKGHLDKMIQTADARLAVPLVGSTSFPKPHNADWAWRPSLWRMPLATPGLSSAQNKSSLGDEVTLFHDCALSELTLRQLRNLREEDLAPFGLRLDVFKFEGSFLSLVIELPTEGTNGLNKTHLLRMDANVEMERPLELFARLNIKNGPNTEQIVRELPLQDDQHQVEFDLAYANLNEKRMERAWIDLIFEGPAMNEIILRDLTFTRRPRAHL